MNKPNKHEIINVERIDLSKINKPKDKFLQFCRNEIKQLEKNTKIDQHVIDNMLCNLYMTMHSDYGLI